MSNNNKIGKFGEDLAANYLTKKGYNILERNVKLGYQEIDIIANIEERLVFIEVKTRLSDIYGGAEEAISRKKTENLKKAIEKYLFCNNFEDREVRLDLVAIDLDRSKKLAKIKHYRDIF